MKNILRGKKISVGAVITALGVIFLLVFFADINSWKIFCPEPITVQGTVTRNRAGLGRTGIIYHPYVKFEFEGKEYEVLINDTLNYLYSCPVAEGTQLMVTVDGSDPGRALSSPGVRTYIFGAVALFMCALGETVLWEEHGGKKHLLNERYIEQPVLSVGARKR